MAPTTFITLTAALLFTLVAAQGPASYAPSPAYYGDSGPAAAPDECFNKLLNVTDCLTFVDFGSNLTKPDEPCCGELAGLVDSSPQCLCELVSTKQSMFNISVSRALQLPSVCHVTTPDVSLCSLYGYPVDVPASAPSPMAGEGPTSGMVSPSGSPGNGAPTSSFSAITSALALGAVLLTTMFS